MHPTATPTPKNSQEMIIVGELGAQSGASGAIDFASFYAEAYAEIARALQITLSDQELGIEAADEAMTRACARWAQVRHFSNPRGWVYRVGLNWALSFRRRAARRLPWADRGISELPTAGDPVIATAIAELDVKYRSVVVCRHLLDWSTEQTSQALELAPGTVKSRLSTAIAQLRAALADQEMEP